MSIVYAQQHFAQFHIAKKILYIITLTGAIVARIIFLKLGYFSIQVFWLDVSTHIIIVNIVIDLVRKPRSRDDEKKVKSYSPIEILNWT